MADNLRDNINKAKQEAEELKTTFSDLRDQIIANGAEMTNTLKGMSLANKEMRGLVSLSTQLRDNQEGISRLSDQQLQKINGQVKSRLKNLKAAAEQLATEHNIDKAAKNGKQLTEAQLKVRLQGLKTQGKIGDEEISLLLARRQNFETEENLVKLSNEELKIRGESNKLMGVGASILDGMAGALAKMGMGKLSQTLGLEDAKKKMQETADGIARGDIEAGKLGGKFKVLKSGIASMGKSLISSLGPLTIIATLFDGMIKADKLTGDLAHNLGMSYNEAHEMSKEMTNIHKEAGNINIQTADLIQSQIAVGKAMGSNAQLNKKDLETMTEMTTAMGVTHDEIMGIQKLSLVNGKSLEKNTKEAMGGAKAYAMSKGLVMDQQQLLKEVSKASASLKLSLGQSTEALGESVAKAKEFGLSLEDAQNISNGLLDFESSIQSELEAELLTGKNLNFEKARQLALEGDIAGAAAEVAKQVGSAAEFGEMNVIQQEAIAKSMGLNREQLAQSLIEREALAAIGAEEGANLQEEYEKMKARGMSEAEIREKIGNDELARQLEQQSLQEQQQQAMMELQSMLLEIGQALMPFFEMLTEIAMVIMPIISDVVGVIVTGFRFIVDLASKLLQPLQQFGKLLMKNKGLAIALGVALLPLAVPLITAAIGGIMATFAMIPFGLGIPLGIAAIAGLFSNLSKGKSWKGDDVMSPAPGGSGYGKRTLLGPEGAISLNNKDTVIAGTNLMGDDVVDPPGPGNTQLKKEGSIKGGGGGGVNMAPVVSAINALGAKIDALGNINVSIDGEKVASTVAGNKEFDRTMNNRTREVQ